MTDYGEIRSQVRLLVDPLLIRFKEELYGSGISFGRIQPSALPPTTIYTTNIDNLGYIKGITVYSGGILVATDRKELSFADATISASTNRATISYPTKITNPMTNEGDYIIGSSTNLTNRALVAAGASASASSSYPGFTPSSAIDANDSTYWVPNAAVGAGEWIMVDLGVIARITRYRIREDSAGNAHTWNLQWSSDAVTWTTVANFSNSNNPYESGSIAFDTPINARYWRMVGVTGVYGWNVYSFELISGYTVAGTPVAAVGGGATGSRPNFPVLYQHYFDTTLAKPYWWDGANWVTVTVPSGGGTGSVTSVGLALPSLFNVSNSPITGSGVITATLVTQNAGTFFAGPASGIAATPNFRTLALADIPSLTSLYQPVDNDLTALAALSSSGIAVRTAADTWVLRTLVGTTNRITVTNGNGISSNPTVDIAATYSGQTTITNVGIITAGTWQATIVAPAYGGTGTNNTGNLAWPSTGGTAALLATANAFTAAQTVTTGASNQSIITALSGGSSNFAGIAVGRTAAEVHLAIAGATNHFFTGSAAGDAIIKLDDTTKKLLLGMTTQATLALTPTGVGIGTVAPSTALQAVGSVGIGGFYDHDTIGATELEILPAGAIAYYFSTGSVLVRDSASGTVVSVSVAVAVPGSSSTTTTLFSFSGTQTISVRVYSTGRVTILRTAGTSTFKVVMPGYAGL